MRVLVDGDGCPGRQIIEGLCKQYEIDLLWVCTINHRIDLSYGELLQVDAGFQSVDNILFNHCKRDDIVITQDFGVAAMVLGKQAKAMSPKGRIYTNENIDKLLFERHMSAKARRAGGRTSGPKKRTIEDDKNLYDGLKYLIEKCNS